MEYIEAMSRSRSGSTGTSVHPGACGFWVLDGADGVRLRKFQCEDDSPSWTEMKWRTNPAHETIRRSTVREVSIENGLREPNPKDGNYGALARNIELFLGGISVDTQGGKESG